MPKHQPREWQKEALLGWEAEGRAGIVSVVTGGGKTVFALSCIDRIQPDTTFIVVPTIALFDQCWSETADYFDLDLDEVHVIRSNGNLRTGTINLAVLNTASKLTLQPRLPKSFFDS